MHNILLSFFYAYSLFCYLAICYYFFSLGVYSWLFKLWLNFCCALLFTSCTIQYIPSFHFMSSISLKCTRCKETINEMYECQILTSTYANWGGQLFVYLIQLKRLNYIFSKNMVSSNRYKTHLCSFNSIHDRDLKEKMRIQDRLDSNDRSWVVLTY